MRDALLAAWLDVGAIDHHCHLLRRWPHSLTPLELRSAFTEALDPVIAKDHVIHTAVYQGALHRLAAELGCEPNENAILSARSAIDPRSYARRLFARSGTGMMLIDTGFSPSDAFALHEQEIALDLPQHEVFRLETLAERQITRTHDAAEWLATIRFALQVASDHAAVGIKTTCAYRASLRLTQPDPDDVATAFRSLKQKASAGEPVRLAGNPLCHAVLFEAAKECIALDLPLQIHCGFGDPDEDLAEASPLGLRPLFIDAAYAGLRIALLHCYPYHREAAYLCSVFPNVYMDLSMTIPFAGLDGFRAMKETLGLCPTSKLLYATDATRYPEVYFVAAGLHREALAEALAELVDRGMMSQSQAEAAGRQVLAENARRLYPLSPTTSAN